MSGSGAAPPARPPRRRAWHGRNEAEAGRPRGTPLQQMRSQFSESPEGAGGVVEIEFELENGCAEVEVEG